MSLFPFSLASKPHLRTKMRPVVALLLLALLALAAGASAAGDLSSGADASAPTGAVLIARKVRPIAWGSSASKKKRREPETHLASISLSFYS